MNLRLSPSLTLAVSAALTLGLACTDDGDGGDEIAADTSGNQEESTSEDTTEESTGDSTEESTETTDTTESTEETEESSEDTTDTTESTEETEESTDTGPVDNGGYEAVVSPGGLDRVIITRKDFNESTCTEMVLYSPVMFDDFDIDVPDPWRIELVRGWTGTTDCPEDKSDPDYGAGGGTGEIFFLGTDALGIYPCAVGFDIELFYSTEPPTTKAWNQDSVEVMGVNCG
ncbi:hypothetical protein PPSIR1_18387 [Plesiocystis pacifica SIR-1]|uniref:Lipoprotein n=1 Tax=Plesiocystis pacifica SIR-1 TaxID=391625 RepID=A6GKM9_9BACT|nr:hypothetical protein [Plesiocystis pacifica]EDM73572.1 hypothetical protein PPSIR1_18387 [Plesiocystis pacifica SIR-1]